MANRLKTQKLSIRLLKEGLEPEDSLRSESKVKLNDWSRIEGAKISLGNMGGHSAPKWADFLDLGDNEKNELRNRTTYGIVFVPTSNRWFAVSFGMGHVKLDPSKYEQNFGLRTVLNTVNPEQIRSVDIRTPDENTLTRRSQTSRASDQTAFNIDSNCDIVYSLAGIPDSDDLGSSIVGKDSLVIHRKTVVDDLPEICSEVYDHYKKKDYEKHFGWIDQILHIRDKKLIEKLDTRLVDTIKESIEGSVTDNLYLAFPVIYDPEKKNSIRYKGFRSSDLHLDLDVLEYIEALRKRGITEYSHKCLTSHTVHEVDDDGRDCGGKWKIRECICFEATYNGQTYVLSGGVWYQIDSDLAEAVKDFFEKAERINLPPAEAGENEESYNRRVAAIDNNGLLCLDRKLIKPTGATYSIEVCDFISRKKELIHVKNKTSSSRLSHLFKQGTVSAQVLSGDRQSRTMARSKIKEVEQETKQTGFESILPASDEDYYPSDYTVVYAVISTGSEPKLPFFSLIAFRQAAQYLQVLGYRCAFSWIKKSRS